MDQRIKNTSMIPDFESFLETYTGRLRQAHEGLNLLSGYPSDELLGFYPGETIPLESRIKRQEDWLFRITSMEESARSFYRIWWMPHRAADPDPLFIDLSDPRLPVFSVVFIPEGPQTYYRCILWNSLSKWILDAEKRINWKRRGMERFIDEFRLYCRFSGPFTNSRGIMTR
jgi:hypothetical protein